MSFPVQITLCVLLAFFINLQTVLDINNFQGQANSNRPILSEEISREISLKDLAEYNFAHLSGGWEWVTVGETGTLARSRFNDAVIEGSFSGTRLELFAYLNKQTFDFELDNAPPAKIVAPESEGYGYLKLANNLPTGRHHFQLHLVNRAGNPLLARSLRTNGDFVVGSYPKRPCLMGYGSSTVDGTGITWQLGRALTWDVTNRGIGGTTVIQHGQNRVQQDVLPFNPDVMLINYGSNDWFADLPLDQFRAAYLNMLNQLATGLPQTHFLVLGLFARKNGNESTRPQYNQAIKEAIQAAGLSGRTKYTEISNYNWSTDTTDGTHPTATTVNTKFVPQLMPLLNSLEPAIGLK